MKTTTLLTFAAMALAAVAARADESADEADAITKAQESAQAWLELVDAGKYPQSWEETAEYFQTAVTKANWEAALKGARKPLGALTKRGLKSAKFTRTLPGAPDGEYVVIQYETQFENKASAIETATPLREKDGSWKVSGYFIK